MSKRPSKYILKVAVLLYVSLLTATTFAADNLFIRGRAGAKSLYYGPERRLVFVKGMAAIDLVFRKDEDYFGLEVIPYPEDNVDDEDDEDDEGEGSNDNEQECRIYFPSYTLFQTLGRSGFVVLYGFELPIPVKCGMTSNNPIIPFLPRLGFGYYDFGPERMWSVELTGAPFITLSLGFGF